MHFPSSVYEAKKNTAIMHQLLYAPLPIILDARVILFLPFFSFFLLQKYSTHFSRAFSYLQTKCDGIHAVHRGQLVRSSMFLLARKVTLSVQDPSVPCTGGGK